MPPLEPLTIRAPPRGARFWQAVYRGLGIVAPPLVTCALLVWAATTVRQLLFEPMLDAARTSLAWALSDVRRNLEDLDPSTPETETTEGPFERLASGEYVPLEIAQAVEQGNGAAPLPATGRAVYERYVDSRLLIRPVVIPICVLAFVLILFLLGRFLAVGMGRALIDLLEQGLIRLPLVRSIYLSVKEVTRLLLSEVELSHARIVAVEFPSPGRWAVGFVTGESLPELRHAAHEPVLSVHVPYPPLLKGSLITVRKSQTIELNMTMDQAVQYVVSCGVLKPPQPLPKLPGVAQVSEE
jgi:uncharacterized membrane protein